MAPRELGYPLIRQLSRFPTVPSIPSFRVWPRARQSNELTFLAIDRLPELIFVDYNTVHIYSNWGT